MMSYAPPTIPRTTSRIFVDPENDPRFRPYQPFGTALDVFYDKSDQVMFCGPSGTGKSRAALEKMHLLCSKYDKMRALMIRKTRTSLTQSAMVTFDNFVIPVNETVHWRTGEQEYRYANGSVIVCGGMDKSIKVMSADYDFIYVQEATELTQDDWETLTTRLRYGRMPYQQIVGDCNPGPPSHWIKRQADKGTIHMLLSHHEDNPILFDQITREITERGIKYIAKLDALTGVRYSRLRKGIWAAAEGMIYTEWNPDIHMKPRFPIPSDWTRLWVVDFGYTNPFCFMAWAIDPDGRAYRIAEIYQTHLLVEDAAAMIRAWQHEQDEPDPVAVICDHDAEDRATLERHLGLETIPAMKQVLNGIHSVKSRLRVQDDGKPKLFWLYDSLIEPDPALIDAMLPTCSEQEIEAYEWENSAKKETPRKVGDHGMDDVRYLSTYLDDYSGGWSVGMT